MLKSFSLDIQIHWVLLYFGILGGCVYLWRAGVPFEGDRD
jgi:hypothetical protein